LQMPTIMVTTISIVTINQTTGVKPTPTCETSSHRVCVYTYIHIYIYIYLLHGAESFLRS